MRIDVTDNAAEFLEAIAALAPEGHFAMISALRRAAEKGRTRIRRRIAQAKQLPVRAVARQVQAYPRRKSGVPYDQIGYRLWGGVAAQVRAKQGKGELPAGAASKPFRVTLPSGAVRTVVRSNALKGPAGKDRRKALGRRPLRPDGQRTALPIDVVPEGGGRLVALGPELGHVIAAEARTVMRTDYPTLLRAELERRGRRNAKRATRRGQRFARQQASRLLRNFTG